MESLYEIVHYGDHRESLVLTAAEHRIGQRVSPCTDQKAYHDLVLLGLSILGEAWLAELIPYDTGNYNQPAVDDCEWKIAKADYDMSAVKWDYSGSKTYNGRAQSIMLEQLPNGVSASYSGNEASEAGSYTAKAVLAVSDPENYNTPSVSECDWEIAKADYDMSDISWDYDPESCVYDGERKTVKIGKLPENVSASYTGNSGVRAGAYTALASFETSDSNFTSISHIIKSPL